MTIRSLRHHVRPDNLTNQVRSGQSLARRLYLGMVLLGGTWIIMQFVGPMIFMDADGMVVQDPDVIMPSFPAQVVSVTVAPGDFVHRGQDIATVVSAQMLDLISDLTTRQAQARSREEQIQARLAAIDGMLPAATKRVAEAAEAARAVERVRDNGFATVTRYAEVAHDLYNATRESESLRAEVAGLKSERTALNENLTHIDAALEKATVTYHDGAVVAPVDGTIGPKVAAVGMVLSPGDDLAQIYHGDKYVVGYVATARLYSIEPGDKVVVMDGGNREVGHITRVEAITDRVPAEFQSSFRSVERQQVVRVAVDASEAFPLLSKVKVTNTYAPSNLFYGGRTYLTTAFRDGVETAKLLPARFDEGRDYVRGVLMHVAASLQNSAAAAIR